ncbi:hypothetical protein UZ36_07510 [Candidatus Nitromaritima sp. SCGC AAA799-C22]|nr:hypothetical protein UZ36_07510 [Candidatus Nitromaritima sp. SCGC AAA799-C22]
MSFSGKLVTLFSLMAAMAAGWFPAPAGAVPLFARNYQLSCAVCHVGFPMLNSFGEAFAGNGYQMPGEDPSERSVDTGDEKLLLLKDIPMAVRVDSFLRIRNDTDTRSDLEGPFIIKLLSSAPLKKNISYYFYFLFNERGNVTGVEDAFVYFNDGYKDVDLDMRVGQFQVTDILFPREQRLTFQDFTYYVTAVSSSGFKLTYDRIAELSYAFDLTEDWAMGLWAAVANGNGIDVADSERNFDSDDFKNFYGKAALEFGGQSVGFYAYGGREKNSASVRNEFYRIGPDFNFTFFDDVNVWGNFLFGEDTNPKFAVSPANEMRSWGGFAGLTWPFKEDWIFSLLYNRVQVMGNAELDAHTMTVNISYYMMRNVKWMLEFTGDMARKRPVHPTKQHAGVFGLVFAF